MNPPTAIESKETSDEVKRRIFFLQCYWFYQRSLKAVKGRWREVFGRTNILANQVIIDVVRKF